MKRSLPSGFVRLDKSSCEWLREAAIAFIAALAG
jgi:hypothetical protein